VPDKWHWCHRWDAGTHCDSALQSCWLHPPLAAPLLLVENPEAAANETTRGGSVCVCSVYVCHILLSLDKERPPRVYLWGQIKRASSI
jgi:hypothetical protein